MRVASWAIQIPHVLGRWGRRSETRAPAITLGGVSSAGALTPMQRAVRKHPAKFPADASQEAFFACLTTLKGEPLPDPEMAAEWYLTYCECLGLTPLPVCSETEPTSPLPIIPALEPISIEIETDLPDIKPTITHAPDPRKAAEAFVDWCRAKRRLGPFRDKEITDHYRLFCADVGLPEVAPNILRQHLRAVPGVHRSQTNNPHGSARNGHKRQRHMLWTIELDDIAPEVFDEIFPALERRKIAA